MVARKKWGNMAREFVRKTRVKVRGGGALKISNAKSNRREEILSTSAQLRRGRERACMLVCVLTGQKTGKKWLGNFFQIKENPPKHPRTEGQTLWFEEIRSLLISSDLAGTGQLRRRHKTPH